MADGGGAAVSDASAGSFDSVQFTENFSVNRAGALVVRINSNSAATNCSFIRSVGTFAAASYVRLASTAVFQGCWFVNGTAAGNNAGLKVKSLSNVTVLDSLFEGGLVMPSGADSGCGSVQSANVVLHNVTCRNSRCSGNPSPVIMLNTTTSQFSGSMGSCVAGGWAFWDSSTGKITSSHFEGLSSFYGGGALYLYGSGIHVSISDTQFVNCKATSGNGGAISLESKLCMPRANSMPTSQSPLHKPSCPCYAGVDKPSTLLVTNSSFVSNSCAGSGGAISVANAQLEVNACVFSSNVADVSAGAVFYDGGIWPLALDNAIMNSNSAPACGAVEIRSASSASVSESLISGNHATAGDGGAICYTLSQPYGTSCLAHSELPLSALSGDMSLVPPGSLVPTTQPFWCAWEIAPSPGCTLNFTFWSLPDDLAIPGRQLITIQDILAARCLTSPFSPLCCRLSSLIGVGRSQNTTLFQLNFGQIHPTDMPSVSSVLGGISINYTYIGVPGEKPLNLKSSPPHSSFSLMSESEFRASHRRRQPSRRV